MSTFNDLPEELQRLVVKYFPRQKPEIHIKVSMRLLVGIARMPIEICLSTRIGIINFFQVFVLYGPLIIWDRHQMIEEIMNWNVEEACTAKKIHSKSSGLEPLFNCIDKEYHPIILDKLRKGLDELVDEIQNDRNPYF